jgi:perosamine synthetase
MYDPVKLKEFCQSECCLEGEELIHKASGRRIPALVVVHVFGNMTDMESIIEITNGYHLRVIEDATEALGSYYLSGRFAGRYAGTIGDIGAYSFNGNKIITTGGGGMLVGNNENLLKHARYLSAQAKDNSLNFVHNEIGYNYRMTNVQAAIGVAQLEVLEKFISIKKQNYEIYCRLIGTSGDVRMLPFRPGTRPNYWFYSLFVEPRQIGIERDRLIAMLNESGIHTRPIWGLIH